MQPHAPELEEAVIGACLIEQEALPLIADKLRPEMFYDDHHQLIFAALMAMYHAGKKIDILTVKEELARRGNLDAIGGPYAIVQLSSKVASSAHIEYHAQIIHQKYLAREMVVGFNKLLTCAMDETIDIDDTLIDAHNLLDRLEGESGHNAHIRDMETLMADTMEEAERRIAKSVNGVTGIPTGLTELDKKTGGLQDNDLIVIAARPSVGKTARPPPGTPCGSGGERSSRVQSRNAGRTPWGPLANGRLQHQPVPVAQRDSQSPRGSGGTHHRLGTGTTAYLRGRQFFRQHGSHPFERTAAEKPQAV